MLMSPMNKKKDGWGLDEEEVKVAELACVALLRLLPEDLSFQEGLFGSEAPAEVEALLRLLREVRANFLPEADEARLLEGLEALPPTWLSPRTALEARHLQEELESLRVARERDASYKSEAKRLAELEFQWELVDEA